MADLIDRDVVLLQELVDLKVVSIDVDRLSVLILGRSAARECNSNVLQRRFALLKKLSQTFPLLLDAQAVSNAADNADNELDRDQTDEKGEAALYVKYDHVYGYMQEDTHARAPAEYEHAAQVLANARVSRSFFSELFPIEQMTEQFHLPGSFPDIADFEGGVDFIGSGFSGLVFKSTLHGVPVVLKVSKERSAEANRSDYNEWSVSDRLKPHSNVLQVVGLCPSFEHPFSPGVGTTAIVSPWQANGALRAFYDSETRPRRNNDLQNIALGMIRGIRSLHEQGVIHRDIAVRNFLVDIDGRVMLCDFGLTRFIPDGEKHIDTRKMPENVRLPWQYLAPESYNHIFSTMSDMWMYGLSLFELVTRRLPWPNIKTPDDFRQAINARKLELPTMEEFPPIIASIVRECLQLEPFARPTANDIAERLVRWEFRDMDLTRDENGNTALHQLLIASDDPQEVQDFLRSQKTVMVNAVNHLGKTPLMLAREKSIVKLLLQYLEWPDVNYEPSRIPECFYNIDFFGTVRKLAENQEVEQIKLIGESIFTYDYQSSFKEKKFDERGGTNGETALHIAAKLGNIELFDALVGLQAINIWKSNNDGRTALHVASEYGHSDIMEKLTALAHAPREALDVEVHRVNKQDKTGKTALHLAASSGDAYAIRVLLECNATNVNLRDFKERTPMFDVILADNADVPSRAQALYAFVHHPGVNLHAKDSTGETILHKVARRDLAQLAVILLQHPDTDMFVRENEHNYAPIHLSVREKSFAVAAILLSKWVLDVNERDRDGNTLLHMLAAAHISPTQVADEEITPKRSAMRRFAESLILREEIDLNLLNSNGDTALHIAIEKDNRTVVEALLLAPFGKLHINIYDTKLRTPLLLAIDGAKADIAEMILSKSDVGLNNVDRSRRTPLHLACYNNMLEIVQTILSKDSVNVNARDEDRQTPLHLASTDNAAEVATLLLSRDDVDVNARDQYQRTPLHSASEYNAAEVAALLLSRDEIDVNARDDDQQTPLHLASEYNTAEIAAMLLLNNSIDINARDKDHQTPLQITSISNAAEVASILLSRDEIDVNARDDDQRTPLHSASQYHAAKVAAMLISKDEVDVNARDENQQTPLHLACMNNAAQVAEIILSRSDVDVNARDDNQQTPLHRAAWYNAAKATKILFARNDIDLGARDSSGKTALDIFTEKGFCRLPSFDKSRKKI